MKRYIPAIAAIACLLMAAAPAGACDPPPPPDPCVCEGNLVLNGDFEVPVPETTENWDVYPTGYFDEDGYLDWMVEWNDFAPGAGESYLGNDRPPAGLLEFHKGNVAGSAAHCGNQKVELDTDWTGPGPGSFNNEPAAVAIYQDLPTCPGSDYTLRYSWRPRKSPSNSTSGLDVFWGGSMIPGAQHDDSGGGVWTDQTWMLDTPPAEESHEISTELRFIETDTADSLGMFLDAVCVEGPSCISCITDLIADGGSEETAIDVGDVIASYDPESGDWWVTYRTDEPWYLVETHLDVQCDPEDFPQNKKGNPKVGHFANSDVHGPGTYEFTYEGTIDPPCDCAYYAAHSVVERPYDFGAKSGEIDMMVTRRRTPEPEGEDGPNPFVPVNEPAVLACTHPSWGNPVGGGAEWIWETCRACGDTACDEGCSVAGDGTSCANSVAGSVITMEGTLEVPGPVDWAELKITCDNGYEVFLNGDSIGSAQVAGDWRMSNLTESFVNSQGWQSAETFDVAGYFEEGENTLTIDAANEQMDGGTNNSNPGACVFDLTGQWIRNETAWGAGQDFPGRNWATWFTCCEEEE